MSDEQAEFLKEVLEAHSEILDGRISDADANDEQDDLDNLLIDKEMTTEILRALS